MTTNTEKETVISIADLKRDFEVGNDMIQALQEVNLEVHSNEFVVIFGPSGCGKSTLLNIILGIDKPTSGTVEINGRNIFALSEDDRSSFRARKIGMIHQLPYWVKSLNVLENIAMPLIIRGLSQKSALERADDVMQNLGIAELKKQYPTQLSGGQQQKVGVARAIASNPWIVLADEPTGNLDSKGASEIIKILVNLNKVQKRTVLLVTHNEDYWDIGTRRIEMKDGKIVKDTYKDGDHGQ